MLTHIVVLSNSSVVAVLGGVGAVATGMGWLLLEDGIELFPWANVGSSLIDIRK